MRKRVVFHVLTVTGLLAATVFSLAHAQEPRILFIGDSHTAGTFGDEFAKELASAFHGQVSRYGVSSSAVLHWMGRSSFARLTGGWRTSQVGTDGNHTNVNGDPRGHVGPDFPTYTQLLGQGFDVVVIALGTNDVNNYCSWNQARQAEAIQLAKSMADRTSGKTCVWVGPPSFTERARVIFEGCGGQSGRYDRTVDALKQELEKSCLYIDSRKFKMPPRTQSGNPLRPTSLEECYAGTVPMYPDRSSDHVHFDSLGRYWAACAGLELKARRDQSKITQALSTGAR